MATQKVLTKTETIAMLSEKTNIAKKEVAAIMDGLVELACDQLSKRGPGEFKINGLVKLKTILKPAAPERKGINPFTKQETVFKARAARTVVKAIPMKALKDAAA